MDDAGELFSLANDDIVRRNSFSQGEIKWAEHLQWLSGKLSDDNCIFLVVSYSGKFAGQVRFDMAQLPNGALINISLCKNVRGLGLSSLVIDRSIKEMLTMRRDVKFIRAYVKDENIPSARAFAKAGFRFLESTIIKGCKRRVYEKVVS